MKQSGNREVANKGKKTPATKKKSLTRKPKTPAKLTPENIEKCYLEVRNTGQLKVLQEILGVAKSTVNKWKNKFPEFGNRISHASDR